MIGLSFTNATYSAIIFLNLIEEKGGSSSKDRFRLSFRKRGNICQRKIST